MTNSTALQATPNTAAALSFAPRLPARLSAPRPQASNTVPSNDELLAAVYGPKFATGARPVAAAARTVSPVIYRRRRIAAGFALVLAGALLWTVLSAITGVGEAPVGADLARQPEPTIHVVQPGDTLWTIAATIDTDGDVRDTVDRLADANGGSALEVGQRLIID